MEVEIVCYVRPNGRRIVNHLYKTTLAALLLTVFVALELDFRREASANLGVKRVSQNLCFEETTQGQKTATCGNRLGHLFLLRIRRVPFISVARPYRNTVIV